jgi:predicted kinase
MNYTFTVNSIEDAITAAGLMENEDRAYITGAQLKLAVKYMIEIKKDLKECHQVCNDLSIPDFGRPRLLMLIGIPGSGKSSWLKTLEKTIRDGGTYLIFNNFPFFVISPDELRKQLSGNISDQSVNVQVWQETKNKTIGCLEHGTNVIIDATNINTEYRRNFIINLPSCHKLAKIFPVTPDVAWKRVSGDLLFKRDRAAVPEEKIYKMYGDYLYTIKVLSSEGFEIIG